MLAGQNDGLQQRCDNIEIMIGSSLREEGNSGTRR